MAENEIDPEMRRAWLTFVVVGGGPTGVEIAGQIAELSRSGLTDNFRRIHPADAAVVLVDGGTTILSAFGDKLSEKAAHELRRLGVTIHTGTVVTGVDAFGVDVRTEDGSRERLLARTKIWAAGVQASPLAGLLARASGASCDRAGRILVRDDCTLPGHPEAFAIGDMMALDELPGVAEVAMQSGIHAANTIKRRLRGKEAASFAYRDLGSMATVSRFHAVVSFKGVRLSGLLGWLTWLLVHITFLTGFRNRLSAAFHWTGTFVAGGRAERTITLRQVTSRVAVDEANRESSGPGDGTPGDGTDRDE
jgi:NADH dehydrogenase